MPFTGAHPMLVLPLLPARQRLHLDATCLVIGSMIPDFEYFVRGHQAGGFGHTWLGVPVWGVPATLVFAALFHGIVKWPLLLVAPAAVTRRLARQAAAPWPSRWSLAVVASLVVSAALGAVTHLVWDAFTHRGGFGEALVPSLADRVTLPLVGERDVVRVLQYASSVVGLVVIAIVVVRLLRRRAPDADVRAPDVWRSRAIFAVALAVGLAFALWRVRHHHRPDTPDDLLIVAISGLIEGALFAGAMLWAPAQRLRQRVIAANPP